VPFKRIRPFADAERVDLTHCAACGAPSNGAYRCPKCAATAVSEGVAETEAERKAELDRPSLPPWGFDLVGSLLRYREYRRQVANGDR
jgi:uncharacterized Zn finger protein (UPF0148 family)